MVPMVGPPAHRDHRTATRLRGIVGELTRDLNTMRFLHPGNRFLPGRRIRLLIIVVGWIVAGQPPRNADMSHH
ncbi:hypothetical protein D3C81_994670 [compost metagenome]